MKKIVLLLFACCFLLPASAQIKFGYISYDKVLRRMPEYAVARQRVADLKVKYEQEATRSEEEFQRKFSEFLQGQKDFPENILLKRQAELQTLMEAGIRFRNEAQQLLTKAEADFMSGVQARLNETIGQVGEEGGYAYVLNTDGNACPFINPALGEDVTMTVLRKLGLLTPEEEAALAPVQEEAEPKE